MRRNPFHGKPPEVFPVYRTDEKKRPAGVLALPADSGSFWAEWIKAQTNVRTRFPQEKP